uniref:CSON011903 protein n=1 Tax=Culicoides sonorensis TaxID=179676 RepID=A0A336M6R7_CULSO
MFIHFYTLKRTANTQNRGFKGIFEFSESFVKLDFIHGYLKLYLKGQEVEGAYDKFDHEFCGNDLPYAVVSDGPRLVMVFSSGELQGRGFKAKYSFETEYKIPGTASPDGSCSFTYKSRYCGYTSPGPIESPRNSVGLKVLLHTDSENVASGFKARYVFEVAKSIFGDCGNNSTGQDFGIVSSPNFPSNYNGPGKGLASKTCNWYITARTGYKLLLNFESFAGFKLVWTEIQDMNQVAQHASNTCEPMFHFQCELSKYCIATRLRCNGIYNCGSNDKSDEQNC